MEIRELQAGDKVYLLNGWDDNPVAKATVERVSPKRAFLEIVDVGWISVERFSPDKKHRITGSDRGLKGRFRGVTIATEDLDRRYESFVARQAEEEAFLQLKRELLGYVDLIDFGRGRKLTKEQIIEAAIALRPILGKKD